MFQVSTFRVTTSQVRQCHGHAGGHAAGGHCLHCWLYLLCSEKELVFALDWCYIPALRMSIHSIAFTIIQEMQVQVGAMVSVDGECCTTKSPGRRHVVTRTGQSGADVTAMQQCVATQFFEGDHFSDERQRGLRNQTHA
eukprot:jgi/Ulvmu1/12609/UM093_0001.1